MTEQPKTTFNGWAVVELFGHTRIAGMVSEESVAGVGFIRVDVPAVEGHAAFTRYYHPNSLYSLAPCDEQTAMAVAKRERKPPIQSWEMPATANRTPAISSGSSIYDTGDEDEHDPREMEDSAFY